MDNLTQLPPNFLLILSISLIAALLSLFILLYLKSKQIPIKMLIIWLAICVVLFAGLGVIATKIDSWNAAFALLEVVSLLLGCVYLWVAPYQLKWWSRSETSTVFLLAETLLCWNVVGLVIGYGLMAKNAANFLPYLILGTLPFLLPAIVIKSYDYWVSIPSKHYRRWYFPTDAPIPRLERIDISIVTVQFTRVPNEKNPVFEGYAVEFPSQQTLGILFHYFLYFHNNKNKDYRDKPIQFLRKDNKPLGWIFYKYTAANQKQYLETDKTLVENNVLSNDTIYAQSIAD